MNKFKRYLGLVVAAILSLFLIVTGDFEFPYATPVTAMDSTVIVRLTVAKSDSFKMWRQATDFMNRCGKPPADPCREMSREISFYTVLGNMTEITKSHPDFWELYYADSKLDSQADTPERRKFTETANQVYAEYLDEVRPRLRTNVWLVNLTWLGLIILCVVYRHIVGGLVLTPFGFVWHILTGGATAAKKVHEKI
jgi:hypothetical protein